MRFSLLVLVLCFLCTSAFATKEYFRMLPRDRTLAEVQVYTYKDPKLLSLSEKFMAGKASDSEIREANRIMKETGAKPERINRGFRTELRLVESKDKLLLRAATSNVLMRGVSFSRKTTSVSLPGLEAMSGPKRITENGEIGYYWEHINKPKKIKTSVLLGQSRKGICFLDVRITGMARLNNTFEYKCDSRL